LTGYKEEIFYNEGGETLEWVAQEMVDAPFLETFQFRPDGALSNLIELKMSLLIAGGFG